MTFSLTHDPALTGKQERCMTLVLDTPQLQRNTHFIGGQWLADKDHQFDVMDPADGTLVTRVPDGGTQQARAAVDAAQAALASWRRCQPKHGPNTSRAGMTWWWLTRPIWAASSPGSRANR